MNQATSATGVPMRATRREWIGLAVLVLAVVVEVAGILLERRR